MRIDRFLFEKYSYVWLSLPHNGYSNPKARSKKEDGGA
jgi:hypothetical protein